MTTTPEQFASACVQLLRLEPPPTEGEIDEILDRFASALGANEETRTAARRILHSRFAIRMEMGQTLTSQDDHAPWVDSRRSEVDPFYWTRYRELLVKNGWPPLVVGTLDLSTNSLLDLLGNPADKAPWQRRGLVMGDVQSGKTAAYAGLISKAADADYRMIILLTGTLENVRKQTQERLDEAFIGFDSRDYLGPEVKRKTRIGVGLIDGRRDGVVFTSRDRDFRKTAASALNISLDSIKEPVLVVTKKNKAVLGRLADWLRARNADHSGRIDLPMLMIDDEADNASINVKDKPGEATAINKAIRDLLSLFRRSSYVGFTATPFANIFIDPASTAEMLGDDLFPRDFIHVLEAPTNYVGMSHLFSEQPSPMAGAVLKAIKDGEGWLSERHAIDTTPGELPLSMMTALRSFLLASAIRDLRSIGGDAKLGGGIHRSMLVNVSRFTAVQNAIAGSIQVALEDIRRAVRLYGALPPRKAAIESEAIAALEATFVEQFPTSEFEWDAVLGALHEAIAPVRVQAVNQSTGASSLDYRVMKAAPGVRVIAVGGNSLSRGLTLEGLSTSYFRRDPRAYDTLLQMGRWFGYREGYEDLCQVWLTEEAEGWFQHVARATGELRRDFARMKRMQATPKEFGLRVRTHPDSVLLITARNKMKSGLDITEVWDVSLMGRGIESSRVYADRKRNQENLELVERLLGRLGTPGSPRGAAVWRDVEVGPIADFLESFLVHPMNADFQGDSIATFLRNAAGGDPLVEHWTVAMPIGGDGRPVQLSALPGVAIQATKRRVKASYGGSLLVSGSSARVGSRSDLRHALSPEDFRSLTDKPEDDLRRVMKGPLLVIYLLEGYEMDPDKTQVPYRDGLLLPALGLHFPGSKSADSSKGLIKYRLNRVAQKEFFPETADEEDDYENDDPDD